jgi:hypothetical protein
MDTTAFGVWKTMELADDSGEYYDGSLITYEDPMNMDLEDGRSFVWVDQTQDDGEGHRFADGYWEES